jgi:Domain of unknown function (DUF5753)
MADQVRHLLEARDMLNVTSQVLAFNLGAHPACSGAITCCDCRDDQIDDVISNLDIYIDTGKPTVTASS